MPIKGKKIGKKFRKQGVLREIHTKIKISLCSHCINDYKGRWSEWGDSNSRHLEPKSSALPTGPHPDMKLRESSQSGQTCGQRLILTKAGEKSRRKSASVAMGFRVSGMLPPIWCSSSQTRRPTNWATPGYEELHTHPFIIHNEFRKSNQKFLSKKKKLG